MANSSTGAGAHRWRVRGGAAALAAWVAILALYGAVRVPLLAVPLERDEGAFGVVAQALLRGDALYRDVLDHKPPGVYLLYAAALTVIPATATAIHTALLLWNGATTLVLASLAAALAGVSAARWTALVFVVVSAAPSVQGFSATTELLLLLPLVASIRLAVAVRWRAAASRRRLVLAVAGALAAAACWIKPPALLPALMGPLLIGLGDRSRPRVRQAGDLAAWLAGGVALSVLLVGPVVWRAGADATWYWTITHNRLYGSEPFAFWAQRAGLRLAELGWDLGAPIVLAAVGALVAAHRRQPHAWFGLTFLLLSIGAACHSPFLYRHYFALMTPAVALAAGLGCAWLQAAVRRPAARAVLAVGAIGLIVGPPLAGAPWYWLHPDPVAVALRQFGPQGFESATLVADHLRLHGQADDTLFIYGSEPQIAFLADRPQATAFATVYPLTGDWPRQRAFQERAWRALAAAPPRWLLMARLPTSFARSPHMDFFLQERLTQLAAGYVFDAALVYERPDIAARLVRTRPPAGVAVLEVWRRRDL